MHNILKVSRANGGYSIQDRVLVCPGPCPTCGERHPNSRPCNKESPVYLYWKRIADRFAQQFGWTPYW